MYTFVEKRIEKDEAELASWYQKQVLGKTWKTENLLKARLTRRQTTQRR